jgi:hypothetical protein
MGPPTGHGAPWIAEVCWSLLPSIHESAAAQRGSGQLDEARRTSERLQALAELLVEHYPGETASYMLLSGAFTQQAKNAWQVEDFAVIEQWSRRSLEAAHKALALDPKRG